MPTTIAPAVNLQAGVVTPAAPPTFSDVGNAVRACVIFNYSSSVLTVTGTFGQKFLGPLTADLFECPGIQGTPSLSPTTIAAANTYVGIAQAVFYYAGDALPTTYPQPLVAFPGGSGMITNGITIPTVATGYSTAFIAPSGTGTITVTGIAANNGQTLTLVGIQSTSAYTATVSGGSATFDIPQPLDTSFKAQFGGGTQLANCTVTASPSLPVPTVPNSSARVTTVTSFIGAASAPYAHYLFGWDATFDSTSAANLTLTAGGVGIADVTIPAGSGTNYHSFTIPLNGFRTPSTVSMSVSAGTLSAPIAFTLRYADGP